MGVVTFILHQGQNVFFLPFVFWICDLVLTNFLRLAFGSTIGMFRPRFNTSRPRRKSVKEIAGL